MVIGQKTKANYIWRHPIIVFPGIPGYRDLQVKSNIDSHLKASTHKRVHDGIDDAVGHGEPVAKDVHVNQGMVLVGVAVGDELKFG